MNNYLVYATTQEHNPNDRWGGSHITMAATQKNTEKALTRAINLVAQKGDNNWHPSDWKVKNWNGRYTMVIKSKTLTRVAEDLKEQGVKNLMGPGNGKCKFHVTLPESLKSESEAKKYASQLSKKEWYLTVVKMEKKCCQWVKYAPLTQ